MHNALKFRSGQVIPLCRVALAGTFLLTSLADPEYPFGSTRLGMGMLMGYFAYALIMAVIAWRDWWLDHQLRIVSFALEAIFSFAVLFLIEGSPGGPISPFMALFVFLLVTGTLIWQQWRLIAVAAALLGIYCLTGIAIVMTDAYFDPHWFGRRLAFMLVIATLVIWFGHSRGKPRAERLDWSIDDSLEERFSIIAAYLQTHIDAPGLGLVWMPEDEPWAFVQTSGALGESQRRVSPEEFDFSDLYPCDAVLFDRLRGRNLVLSRHESLKARRGRIPLSLADFLNLPTGLLVPIHAEAGQGALVLIGSRAMSPDYLRPTAVIAQEIALALDRHEINAMTKAAEIAHLREKLARDLHDSVVQTLAGESLRLGVLRAKLAQGRDIAAELGLLHESLDEEQRNVQRIIGRLHETAPHNSECDLGATIAETLARLGRQWGIDITLDMTSDQQTVAEPLAHEFELLLREAIANAVRHGNATSARVQARIVGHTVRMTIIDNGRGFPASEEAPFPRSITQRVQHLGGTLDISTSGSDTTLSIVIPGVGPA